MQNASPEAAAQLELYAAQRLIDGRPDAMAGFGGRNDAFGPGKLHPGFKGRHLRNRQSFDQPFMQQLRYQGRSAMVSQAAGVNPGRRVRMLKT